MKIRISIIALIISIASFLFAFATHLRQVRLQVVQSYQKMRIDIYEMVLSLSKVVRELSLEHSNESEECVKLLNNNIVVLKNIKEMILKTSEISPWISWLPGYGILEMEREQIKGHLEELKRHVEAACESYSSCKLPQLQEFTQGINKVGDELA
ncbi:MAG: hypothetical protein ACFFCW_44060 [Candidatus Hodarchaeota archaeon]